MIPSVVAAIFDQARRIPQKTALVFPRGEKLSYAGLVEGILTFAEALRRESFDGEAEMPPRILIAAEKKPEFFFAYFGLHLAGLIPVPVDPETNSDRLEKIVKQTNAIAFCGDSLSKGITGKNLRRIAEPKPDDGINKVHNTDFSEKYFSKNGFAEIVFTTGTTGEPKGVCLTHVAQVSAVSAINAFVGTEENDVEVVALPICHSFGLGRVRCLLSVGATCVFVNGFAAVKRLFLALAENRATGFAMVPASWAYLKKMSGEKIAQFAESLRYIEIGSAPMPLEDKQLLMRLFPKTRICMHYGLTEASRSAFLEFHADSQHLDSVGRPSSCAEIAIFDENGRRLPTGTQGEICVRGSHVFAGYWHGDLAKKQYVDAPFFAGGFFRTGDLGWCDAEGYFHLSGRAKEQINVGGKKVSPQEIEEKLNSFSEIEECACIGVPDPDGILGEVVKACIVPAPGAVFPSDEELRARLIPLLEPYKIPVQFECVSAIPKTSSGKLQRKKLK